MSSIRYSAHLHTAQVLYVQFQSVSHFIGLVTPCAHARSGVKQSVLSISQSVSSLSVGRKKLKSPHIDPHKPSKWSQTIANSKKLLYVYLTEVKVLCFAVFRLFPTFHNYS